MNITQKGRPYPENIYLKGLVAVSGRTIIELAAAIGVSRQCLQRTVNGFYKGTNVVPKLIKELNIEETHKEA